MFLINFPKWRCHFWRLTLKASVSQRFPTETFVVFHSVDYDRSSKNMCKNKNMGLLQAGPGLKT